MTSDEILMDAEERMEKAVSVYKEELRGLRTGRATPALVDTLRVEYYGSPTPLKQLARISTPDPQSIVINPFDPSVIQEVAKAIRSSSLGMAPNVQGNIIRRNLVMGNPPVQVDVDHSSANGWDIKNLADDGANMFRDNTCLTAINAPCHKKIEETSMRR